MAIATPLLRYQATQVQTASPARLVLMLFDGAIRFMQQGKASLQDGRIEDANRQLGRAQAVISELMSSLKLEAGPLAKNLYNIYDFLRRHLALSLASAEPWRVQQAIDLLTPLRDAWEQACVREGA